MNLLFFVPMNVVGFVMWKNLFFLCEDDIPYDDTWDRSGDQKRKVFHKQIIADLQERRIPYIPLTGSLTERMQKVDQMLAGFNKYSNYLDDIEDKWVVVPDGVYLTKEEIRKAVIFQEQYFDYEIQMESGQEENRLPYLPDQREK